MRDRGLGLTFRARPIRKKIRGRVGPKSTILSQKCIQKLNFTGKSAVVGHFSTYIHTHNTRVKSEHYLYYFVGFAPSSRFGF